ncbi:MAG: ECF transporter S component [Clostridiaceae bacterium]|nr:ECF transporter S component [Clostridiaceae bacterium]
MSTDKGGYHMRNGALKKLILNGLMIALVFLATYFTRIPTMVLPGGYFNLGDAVIILAAVLLGPAGGLIAGAVGSALADVAAAALIFAPITFVVKGIEGLLVGLLTAKFRRTGDLEHGSLILSAAVGAVVMVAGYFLAEAFLLAIFDEAFGLTAAVAELLPNSLQGIFSAIIGYILVLISRKTNLDKNLFS